MRRQLELIWQYGKLRTKAHPPLLSTTRLYCRRNL